MTETAKPAKETPAKTSAKKATGSALKDWRVVQNDIDVSIKKGDDVSQFGLPEKILDCLRTEQVIK